VATAGAAPVDAGRVNLRDLRIIQFHEGRAREPHPLNATDRATVLRILEADLAWLEDNDRRATAATTEEG